MPALTNDQSSFAEGDLNQELIDQMLSAVGRGPDPDADPWSDTALQAEIDAAREAAGVLTDVGAPNPIASHLYRPASRTTSANAAPRALHPVQLMALAPEPPSLQQTHGIELLMHVALEVSVELGRSHMSIGEILALRTGSLIELDKVAGEPVEVSANGALIARGEVVVVDEKLGVRVTEVVSNARRLGAVG
jgi:flagellar motor switch protein FliN